MLCLDRREPPALATALRSLGLPTTHDLELTFGDAAWSGHGEHGSAQIGVERKRLSDLVNSMKDRRLSGHQLRGLWQSYDYVFLIIEDVWRPGSGGEIEYLNGHDWQPFYSRSERRAVSYRQIDAYLNSLALRSRSAAGEPLHVKRSGSLRETAEQIASLYRGFTEKTWHEHHSHDQIFTAFTLPYKGHGSGWAEPHEHEQKFHRRTGLTQKPPTTLWRMAAQLPGVDRRAEQVAEYFRTVRRMAEADEEEWEQIDGIGKKIAAAAVRAIAVEGA